MTSTSEKRRKVRAGLARALLTSEADSPTADLMNVACAIEQEMQTRHAAVEHDYLGKFRQLKFNLARYAALAKAVRDHEVDAGSLVAADADALATSDVRAIRCKVRERAVRAARADWLPAETDDGTKM